MIFSSIACPCIKVINFVIISVFVFCKDLQVWWELYNSKDTMWQILMTEVQLTASNSSLCSQIDCCFVLLLCVLVRDVGSMCFTFTYIFNVSIIPSFTHSFFFLKMLPGTSSFSSHTTAQVGSIISLDSYCYIYGCLY